MTALLSPRVALSEFPGLEAHGLRVLVEGWEDRIYLVHRTDREGWGWLAASHRGECREVQAPQVQLNVHDPATHDRLTRYVAERCGAGVDHTAVRWDWMALAAGGPRWELWGRTLHAFAVRSCVPVRAHCWGSAWHVLPELPEPSNDEEAAEVAPAALVYVARWAGRLS